MKIFENIIKINDLVFDVGSNIGDKIMLFSQLGAKVIGFEPQKQCYDFAFNRFKNNSDIIIENIALDKQIGKSEIMISNDHVLSSMNKKFIEEVKKERFYDYHWDELVPINTDTLDNMILKYGKPNFIKIDVEGYELNVLQGLTNQIKIISIEFTPELCENTIQCIEYLEKLNDYNNVFNYGYRNNEYFQYDNWITKNEILTYLKSINDFAFEFGDVYIKNTFIQ